VVALSNSGETEELVRLLETIKRMGARLVTITGHCASTLAQASDVALDCHVSEEACPMNLVVTIDRTTLAAEVLNILERRKITSVVVVDRHLQVEGVVQLHDRWRTERF